MGDKVRDLYKKAKELTGFNYQDMADKVGVSKQHINQSFENQSMIYRTSVATIIGLCVDDKVAGLEKHIEELKAFKKDVMLKSIDNIR